ncbi:vitamin B12-dependent ribonucleotide reductase [Clostridium cellulovorans]|uniref:Vitamin B12-dependent ribonucleotide reductase n=1 Tax=Clostridium cellulovorans (strain ATCC 35296 / DSM 3052 / OCM 3 / 743B) TaxID=573061 RepID=D9SWY3_CLOC7|nr:vitamin B12-dependent ribonucleotide reductase [Clostridium cellulovorans]ADL51344.1 ribonucleoside-diphosphate reductase, adenosylcobalamin-dependent [Clostridium cellulovorans 743B]
MEIIKRHFTKQLTDTMTVYDLFEWKKVDVLLKDYKTGKSIVDMRNLEFPVNYSQSACDIIASKYFRRSGIPNEFGYENSMRQVAHRLVSFWTRALIDEKIITTDEEKSIFYDEMVYCILAQMVAPNSPQWFNTGLSDAYDIKGNSTGSYYYDEHLKKVVQSDDAYTRTQASACFILSIEDKLLGNHSISQQFETETRLFKGGSGCGTNFSTIRAKGEKLSGGGVSSGVMSFLKGLDRNAGAIKSGGTTRRAAKMVILDSSHPEIMDFITWKAKEEQKVRDLGKMGYDISFDGEAYETVSGQNGNNSVRFSDDFMEKVKNLDEAPDSEIQLTGRIDSTVDKSIKVSELWKNFNKAVYDCADPAPMFSDTLNSWHTCPGGEDGKYFEKHNMINATNPCGEYCFLDDTSCNLASLNLLNFYDKFAKIFDIESYLHVIGLSQLLLEASVHFGQFPTEDVARKTYMFRTTGLGVANGAALLLLMGLPYDSEEGRTVLSSIIGLMTGHSYYVSAMMAKAISPFEKYEINKEHMLKVIRNHARVAGAIKTNFENLNYTPVMVNHEILESLKLTDLSMSLKNSWKAALDCGNKYGYRNAQVTVIAPTGTISFAMDCATTSIEPFFNHIVYKKLVGGNYMTIVNPLLMDALINLGYSEKETNEILSYVMETEMVKGDGYEYEQVKDGKIEGAPHLKDEHLPIFDTANKCGSGKRYISALGHVKMVAAITPLISGSVSKTVNLPKDATVKDFEDVCLTSWELGIKGITLYRDGSKASQPLNSSLKDAESTNLDNLSYSELLSLVKKLQKESRFTKREKPIGIRSGKTHPAQIGDVKIYTTVNRNDSGEISEIYITSDRQGTLVTGLLDALSKSISVMLQYHVPPYDISNMLRGQKYEPYGFVQNHPYIKNVTSISDLISKIIDIELGDFSTIQIKPNNYLDTETLEVTSLISTTGEHKGERVYDKECTNCYSTHMIKNGTCYVCADCGTTTGCS